MTAALIIIDMQMEMQHRIDEGGGHVNGKAAEVITKLAKEFRARSIPVVHVRHQNMDPASPFHIDASGFPPMPCDYADDGEAVFVKTTSSAFMSTPLESHLREQGIERLYITGAVAGFCVASSIRSACDLGFQVTAVKDAILGFDLPSAGLDAEEIFNVTMALLESNFSKVASANVVLKEL